MRDVKRRKKKLGLGPLTIHDLGDLFIQADLIGITDTWKACAEHDLEVFLVWLNGRRFIAEERGSVDLYAEWIAFTFRKFSNLKAHKLCSMSGRFCNWLERNQYIINNPHRATRRPRIIYNPPRIPFTVEEYERLKAAAASMRGEPRLMYWAIIVGWATGMAMVDVCMLKWSDVDMENLVIHRARQKTGGQCTIPIAPGSELHEGLKRKAEFVPPFYPNDAEKGLFYVDHELALRRMRAFGQWGMAGSTVGGLFTQVRDKAGVDDRKTFHNFRATMCSALANAGINLSIACAITGHKSTDVFKRYVTPNEGAVREQMRRALEYRELEMHSHVPPSRQVEDRPEQPQLAEKVEAAA